MWWKKKDTEEEVIAALTKLEEEIKTELEPEEEWVWVEGYKSTDENMQGYNHFQFELNKEYECNGEIMHGHNGFHFASSLLRLDYFLYPWWNKARYFKVKGLVHKNDIDNYTLVAKKIILLEEITLQKATYQIVTQYDDSDLALLENHEDWLRFYQIGYDNLVREKAFSQLSNQYSEMFKHMLIDRWSKKCQTYHWDGYQKTHYQTMQEKIKEANVYIEEGLSKDVAVYLLMKDL